MSPTSYVPVRSENNAPNLYQSSIKGALKARWDNRFSDMAMSLRKTAK